MSLADFLFAAMPQKKPSRTALQECLLVSHRGEHDNVAVPENTMVAFRTAAKAGVWGVELDIRWTRDLHPVVIHDPDGGRIFGRSVEIANTDLEVLRRELPLVPTLEEVVVEFGARVHLMIEIKDEFYPEPELQKDRLKSVLSGLNPTEDYHFLALDTALFDRADFAPAAAFLPVAELAVEHFSELAIKADYAGMCGHYALLGNRLLARHRLVDQSIGTGYISSRNVLFRELSRGVKWVFSNDAVAMQREVASMLASRDGVK
jgi:glycerophosphoryl diester phosphodiesterase